MKKLITGMVLLLFLCLSPLGKEQGYAAQITADGYVGINAEYTSLTKGSIVRVNICSNREYMGNLDVVFQYDKSVFEQVTTDDVDAAIKYDSGAKLKFDTIRYNEDVDNLILMWHVKKGLPMNHIIATVNFKLKKTVDYTKILMSDIYGLYGDGTGDENDMETPNEYHADEKLTCSIGGNRLNIESGTAKGRYGEKIVVPLKVVENNCGFCVLGLDMYYEPDVLEYQDVEIADQYKSKLELKSVYCDVEHRSIKIALVGASDIIGTGNFLNMIFKIKEVSDAEVDKTTFVDMTVTQVTNASGESVPTRFAGSTISIGKTLNIGDVNGDDSIDLIDALWILQYYNEIRTLDDDSLQRADVNKSNRVDLVDAVMIMKYYNGENKLFSS